MRRTFRHYDDVYSNGKCKICIKKTHSRLLLTIASLFIYMKCMMYGAHKYTQSVRIKLKSISNKSEIIIIMGDFASIILRVHIETDKSLTSE